MRTNWKKKKKVITIDFTIFFTFLRQILRKIC